MAVAPYAQSPNDVCGETKRTKSCVPTGEGLRLRIWTREARSQEFEHPTLRVHRQKQKERALPRWCSPDL